ncbi:uncharacterized protein GJ701_000665 [Geothlypis trichas]
MALPPLRSAPRGAPGSGDPTVPAQPLRLDEANGISRCPPPPLPRVDFSNLSAQPRCPPSPSQTQLLLGRRRGAAAPEGRKWLGRGAGAVTPPGRDPGVRRGLRREAPRRPRWPREGRVRRAELHTPPLPASPGTPEQTLQRFILTKKQSAASKLLLRAGQEKWVFNRQGRRAWQPATAAGEINKQRSCNFRSEQKLRSRREEPAGRASSPGGSGPGEHLRPLTLRLAPAAPGPERGRGRQAPCGARSSAGWLAAGGGQMATLVYRVPAVLHAERCCAARPAPGRQEGRGGGSGSGASRSRSGNPASAGGFAAVPGGSRSLQRRGSAVSAPPAAPRGRRAPALAARSGLGAERTLSAAAHQPPRCLPPPPRSLPALQAAGQS